FLSLSLTPLAAAPFPYTTLFRSYEAQLDRVSSAQRTMTADSLVSARRIRQPITGNGDIETAFDGITYQKGAAVLAMFEAFVGEEDRKSTRLNSSHVKISYAVFCL